MSVKAKVLFYLGSVIIFMVVTLSVFSYLAFSHSSINNYKHNLKVESFLISNALEQRMSRIFDVLEVVAQKIPVENGSVNESELIDNLGTIVKNIDVINSYLGLENGKTYSTSNRGIVPNFNAKELKREWYTRAFKREHKILTKPYLSAEGHAVMAAAVPVIRSGKVVAVLCVNLDIHKITEYINSLSDENKVFVSNQDSYIIAAKDPSYLGENLLDIRPSYSQYKSKDESLHSYNFEGNEYVVASSRMKSLGWNIWAWENWDNVNKDSYSTLLESILISGFMVAISLFLIFILIVKLVYRPIGGEPEIINAMLKKISSGDLNVDSGCKGHNSGIYASAISMVNSLKNVIKSITGNAEDLDLFSSRVYATAKKVTQSSKLQMAKLEQTSSAVNQMTATSQDIFSSTKEASLAADQAKDNADKGLNTVDEMSVSINALVNEIQHIQIVIKEVSNETNNIGGILEVIQSIAEQTNLLALNAAIEAARAGDQGRGFSVVADEVRNLANKTQNSTNEIREMIVRLQTKSNDSVKLMEDNSVNTKLTLDATEKACLSLKEIQRSVSVIKNMNDNVLTLVNEQNEVVSNINGDIAEVNMLAKNTFDSADSNQETAVNLSGLSKSLVNSVGIFKT